MFEVGSEYSITMLEYGQNYEGAWAHYESSRTFEVSAVDGNLVKLLGPDFSSNRYINTTLSLPDTPSQPREEIILNIASLFFVKAVKVVAR